MSLIYLFVSALLLCGLLCLLGIHPKSLAQDILTAAQNRPPDMRSMVAQANGKKKKNAIVKQFDKMKIILTATERGEQYTEYCFAALILCACGLAIALSIGNFFLAPVLMAGGLVMPAAYILLTANSHMRYVNTQTGAALSLVTSTYLRTDNLIQAVDDNIQGMRGPAKKAFRLFAAKNEYVSANIERSLSEISVMMNNSNFREWCRIMILCQHDHTKKDMLLPLLAKQRNMQVVQIRLDGKLQQPVQSFKFMVILAVSAYPIIFFVSRDWFMYLFDTIAGQIVTAVTVGVLLYCLFAVLHAVRPIEYKQ